MLIVLLILMILQVILFSVDEHYFHRQRGLSKHEVISSITDAILYIIPLVIATFLSFSDHWKLLYILLSALSCLSIVKNELFYPALCTKERLVHALLYVLHPILLYTFYISWERNFFAQETNFWMFQILYVGFGFKSISYQIIYWVCIHERKED